MLRWLHKHLADVVQQRQRFIRRTLRLAAGDGRTVDERTCDGEVRN